MTEDRRDDNKPLSVKPTTTDTPAREEMTEIMKAHLDLIEGGASHYSKWSSVS